MNTDADNLLLPCRCSLHLKYINSKREISERLVDVVRFNNRPDGHFVGYCHNRKRVRTFAYNGIAEAADAHTGEIIAADRVFLHLLKTYQYAPERALDNFLQSNRPIINILIYIGHCDGRLVKLERDAIVEWLLAESGLSSELAGYAADVIKTWAQPDFPEFLFSVASVMRDLPDSIPALLHKAEDVAAADHKLHKNENTALNLMHTLFQESLNQS